jgi:hypothetical protein
MFGFTPLSELECLNLMQPGEYDFSVEKAEPKVSKKTGKDMIMLTLRVYDNLGRERVVIDHLIDSLMYKVKHFCDSVGLEAEYAAGGFLPEICVGRSGKCKIIIDEPEEGSPYQPKNAVKDYIKRTASQIAKEPVKDDGFGDKDIPF